MALSATDGLILSDATIGDIVTAIIQAIATDGIMLSDSAQSIAHFDVTVSDGTKFSETVSTIMQFLAAIADGFKTSDVTREGELYTPRGRVHIDFTSRTASIVFTSINGGKIIFTVRRPEIDFTKRARERRYDNPEPGTSRHPFSPPPPFPVPARPRV